MTVTHAVGFVTPQTTPIAYTVNAYDDNHYKGNIVNVVEPEPTFMAQINSGFSEITLNVDAFPENLLLVGAGTQYLHLYDVVSAYMPGGILKGRWKYEKYIAVEHSDKNTWTIHLTPMTAEMQECDYEANWTPSPDEDFAPPLGSTTFDVPINAAVPRTKHCWVKHVDTDGLHYDLIFRRRTGRVIDAPNRAIDMGGPDYWWFLGGDCGLEVRRGPRNSFSLDNIVDVIYKDPTLDGTTTINAQRVLGGNHQVLQTDPNTGLTYYTPISYEAFYVNMDPSDPYSVPNIGRRVGAPWRDPGAQSQAATDQLARNLVQRHDQPQREFKVRLRPASPDILPGDQVSLTVEGRTTYSNLWVKAVSEFGSTTVKELTLSSALDFKERPFRARGGQLRATVDSTLSSQLPTNAGGTCGGYQPLARVIPSSLTETFAGGVGILVGVQFILDSGGNCQIEAKFFGSIRITPASSSSPYALFIMCDEAADLTGTAASGTTVHVEPDGKYHPLSFFVPSGKGLPDGTYTAYLAVNGAAATIDLDYDLQVWLYSGGNVVAPAP